MKRSSKPDDEEEAAHDDGIVHAEPIIVDHPPKLDPKLLNTVLKVKHLKQKDSPHMTFYIHQ